MQTIWFNLATAINICHEKQKPVELLFDRNHREPETEIRSLHALRELINYLIMWRILFNRKVQARKHYSCKNKHFQLESHAVSIIFVMQVGAMWPNIYIYIYISPYQYLCIEKKRFIDWINEV